MDKPTKREKMNFDDMLEELGEMGKFQFVTYFLVCVPVLFAGANSLSYVFTAGIPNYRCYIPECDDPQNLQFDAPWLPNAIPTKAYGVVGDEYVPAQCQKYLPIHNSTNNNTCAATVFLKEIVSCDRWVFDENDRTIVNDWNIVCLDNQWKLSLVGTIHFAGIIVGTAFFGFLADKFGRKKIFIFCIILMGLSGILQAVAPEYITFSVLIFINSVGTAGVYPLAFILGVEMVGRKKREATGIILNYFYALGEAVVALIAWISGDWVWTQILVSAPCVLFFVYYWWIPESVRWLLVNNKPKKAKGIVCKVAKVNKVILSEHLLSSFHDEPVKSEDEDEPSTSDVFPVVKSMFKSTKMVFRFAIVLFVWITNAFVYYGLSLNSTSMSGNKYLNFALMCLIEIPGYTLAWVSIKYFGRRKSLIFSLILCGTTCIATTFIPLEANWAIITLSLIGKLGITSSFGIIFVYTAELLPTQIRSGGVGSSSTTGRFGALIAPFIPLLGVYVQPLPMILFGGISILAGLLALKLPETKGIRLPETVEEANLI